MMTSVRSTILALLLPLALAVTGACSPSPGSASPPPERIRVSVLPDQEADVLREQYAGLVAHLAAETGLDVEFILSDDYDDLLERFDRAEIDLAWFGGLTFLRAEQRSGATPLVMRDVDQSFTSDFLVAQDSPAQSLHDLAGATLAFGPRLSTSGHLMPRAHLERLQLVPETHFSSVSHSSGHDETARLVQDGSVTVGAVNSIVVEAMLEDGRLSPGSVRVLDQTPPYRNYLWAVHPELHSMTRTALRDAFMELQAQKPSHADILHRQGAGGYVPVSRSDYDALYSAAMSAGLLTTGPS